MSVRVKICGITGAEDAELALSFGADIVGLNFYPSSPRSLTLERARPIREIIGNRCEVVGVFVNAPRDYVADRMRELRLDALQFHGDESDDDLAGWPVKVIRALRLKSADSFAAIAGCNADYVLLDTFHPALFGGTGVARSLDGLDKIDLGRAIISGGLTPDNVAAAAALRPYAVDVASGVESAPGIKDPSKLRSFIVNAKSAR
ncbi:MAG TPA: phosphoribosylanthranilate isomerase [Candidatus Binataceae bacterium]|jgi:phosphoribosylanthranilate isomerase|nr:phosphoribosylanthranilate isomerase [Candidatus Binataceae bacterium]